MPSPYIVPGLSDTLTPELIYKVVHTAFQFDENESFLNHGRKHPYIFAVQIYAHLLNQYGGMKPPAVARFIKRDRTTAIFTIKKVENEYMNDKVISLIIQECQKICMYLVASGNYTFNAELLQTEELKFAINQLY